MIAELRREFNQRYSPEKYARFLQLLEERSGTAIHFRNCETPCFFPEALLEEMVQAGKELAAQLVGNKEYLDRARQEIPAEFLTANEAPHPMFLQADFGLVLQEDGSYLPQLVELQGFPSLYGFQHVVASAYRDAYSLGPVKDILGGHDEKWAVDLFRQGVVADCDPENVVLLEIDPQNQKTLPDFLVTERMLGLRTVDIRSVEKRGRKLYSGGIPIDRIYNRAIVDELVRKDAKLQFQFSDDLDVEWAGHPNWFYLISKFSLPYLKHRTVPEACFLDMLETVPMDLENYVLKPLYSFAGLGVKVGVTREDLAAVPSHLRGQYLLQRRVKFTPVIETPHGPTQAEIRIMYIWRNEIEAVTTIVRMGRGKMMGVDHNRDMEWVGASAGFYL